MRSSSDIQIGPAVTRFALAGLFAAASRVAARIETRGLSLDTGAPRTIFAITHKRDLDAFAPPPILLAHRGWRALAAETRFAQRADAFQPGYVSRLIGRPAWLTHALRPIAVGGVLRAAGVYPLDGFHSRPAELWIREALAAEGDAPAGSLLAPEALQAFAKAAGQPADGLAARPLSTLLGWRYTAALSLPTGPRLFTGPARRRAERRLLDLVERQLQDIAGWLRASGSLYTSFEGRLSPDGRLSPVRAGLRRLLRAAPPNTRIQPIAIVYDFMTTGRQRMWIDLTPPLEDVARATEGELERRLRAAWLDAARFTATQVTTAALVTLHAQSSQREPALPALVADLAGFTHELAVALDAAGRRVDPALLTADDARRRVERYLRYATRRGLARLTGVTYTIAPGALPTRDDAPAALPGIPLGGTGYRAYPMRYAWNEALEMLNAAGLLPASGGDAPAYMAGAGAGGATGLAGAAEVGRPAPKKA